MSKAVVLLSGGMDSLVTAAVACQDNAQVYFLHATYGQRTQGQELNCFNQLVKHYKPAGSLVIDLSYLSAIGASALTDHSIQVPDYNANENGVPITYVPFRNANLLAAAVSWAEALQADKIYIGAVEEDSSGYPDCRQVFYQAFQQTINTGTKDETNIQIVAPVINLNKTQIVKLGQKLNVPFASSWSCYKGQTKACGVCDSCRLRLRAFAGAGLTDPLDYETRELQ